MRKAKKAICLLLVVALSLCMIPTAFAASDEANDAAQALYELGLFSGTGTDASGNPIFDLDRAPTRHEAVTMLVRLLGKAEEAASGTWNTPFTDVAEWAKPYVGYAYANELTAGTSATTYSGNKAVTASQYLTFVLRALGYTSGTDFQWDKAWELSDEIGLTNGEYNESTTSFTRGDVAIISVSALTVPLKGQTKTLIETLKESGAVDAAKAEVSVTAQEETQISSYSNLLNEIRAEIDECLETTPVDLDTLKEDYDILLELRIGEYVFKTYAYGYFTDDLDPNKFEYILDYVHDICDEMKEYFDEEEVENTLKSYAAFLVSKLDRYDYSHWLVGSESSPDVDAMWERVIGQYL